MKPIDELVALLEESGVEFEFRRESMSFGRLGFAKWGKEPDEIDGVRWKFKATEMPGDALMFHVTADTFEDVRCAIEATLGRGTCHVVREQVPMPDGGAREKWSCSECGGLLPMSTYSFATFDADIVRTGGGSGRYTSNYCPDCGRKVVK